MKRTDLKKSLKTIRQQIHASTPKNLIYDTSTHNTTKSFCECTDSAGDIKILYKTKKEALSVILDRSQKLTAYPCPHENGWHLTKN